MVSTTMWSSAPQLEEMATSYFSSMAPRSPCRHKGMLYNTATVDAHHSCRFNVKLLLIIIICSFVYQSPEDAGDPAGLLLLHQGIQDLSAAAVGG